MDRSNILLVYKNPNFISCDVGVLQCIVSWTDFHFSVVLPPLFIACIPLFNRVIMFFISIQSFLILDCSVFITAYFCDINIIFSQILSRIQIRRFKKYVSVLYCLQRAGSSDSSDRSPISNLLNSHTYPVNFLVGTWLLTENRNGECKYLESRIAKVSHKRPQQAGAFQRKRGRERSQLSPVSLSLTTLVSHQPWHYYRQQVR